MAPLVIIGMEASTEAVVMVDEENFDILIWERRQMQIPFWSAAKIFVKTFNLVLKGA